MRLSGVDIHIEFSSGGGRRCSLYADPNDIDALKEKLRQIIEDEELRKLCGKGFVQASKFDWKTAELTHNVYMKI